MEVSLLPIRLNFDKIAEFCQHYHIQKLALFGSVLREDFTNQSDVDVLVEFEQGMTPGLAIITMEDELSQIINRTIDLRTPKDLSRYFREDVMKEALVIYEQN
jgi:predicted nucleotidyltransferase